MSLWIHQHIVYGSAAVERKKKKQRQQYKANKKTKIKYAQNQSFSFNLAVKFTTKIPNYLTILHVTRKFKVKFTGLTSRTKNGDEMTENLPSGNSLATCQ